MMIQSKKPSNQFNCAQVINDSKNQPTSKVLKKELIQYNSCIMNGLSPSSAVFKSSISERLFWFLLLSTYPIGESKWMDRWMIGTVGFLSAGIACCMVSVQSAPS
jgi:hypothetical protein